MGALAFATNILAQLPGFIAAGYQVKDLIEHTNTSLTNAQSNDGKITVADWEASNKLLADARGVLHAPD